MYIRLIYKINVYIYIYIGCRVLFRNFGKIKCFQKFGKNSVSESLLSQHLMGLPNINGVHGTLYGTW